MAEFVEDRHHIIVRHERRMIARWRREVANQRGGGPLIGSVRQQLAIDNAKFSKVIVFAFTREHVEVEETEWFAGSRVGHGVHLQIVNPLVRRLNSFKL